METGTLRAPMLLGLLLAAAPFSIAAPGFRCAGLDEAVCDAYVEHFSTVLAKSGRLTVRTRNDLNQLLGVERQKALLGCSDTSCLVEMIGGLGVDAVLSAGITRTENSFIATLRVLRARDGAELVTASSRLGSARELEDWLEAQAETFAEKLAPAPVGPPVNKARVALLAGGGVLLVTGTALFAWSKADAQTLKGDVPLEQIDGIVQRGSVTQPLGLTLGIVGAAAVVGGLAWLLVKGEAPAATVAPVPGGGAMLSISGVLP